MPRTLEVPDRQASDPPMGLQIDLPQRRVTLDGEPVELGRRCFDLLATLAAQPGRVFSRAELFQAAWPGRVVEEINLRVQISKLRQRLGPDSIVNVSGRGYACNMPVRAARPQRPTPALPPPAATLLGRDDDLAALHQMVSGQPLVTVLGSGGIGKTRLALALADTQRPGLVHGVWWVDLAPLQTAMQIARAVALAVGLQPGAMREADAGARLGAALQGREGLLVLDNAEHLAEPLAGLLQALLPLVHGLRVLVTSQLRLQLPQEQVYRLEPLAPEAALQLLLRRAQAVDHRFGLADGQRSLALHLCQALDGIPLALEMAGARLPALGLEALHSRLGERLRLLGGEHGAAPERQRTLQAALAWSHGLLSADEQAVLRRLSVFAAPFRLESAQRVASDGTLDELAVLQAVAALVDKSLLQGQPEAGPERTRRYRLLESTRLFAARALDTHAERTATEARHAQAMAALAERAQADYWTRSDDGWAAAWRADHDDFLLGFDRAFMAGDADAAALISEALNASANVTGFYSALMERLPAALMLLPLAGPLARARLWNRCSAHAAPGLTRYEAAGRRLQAWRLVGEPMSLARALAQWASEQQRAGHTAEADTLMAELTALEQTDWPPRQRVMGVALAQLNIATIHTDGELLSQSMRSWQALAQAGGLRRVAAMALSNLATADLMQRRPADALQKLQAELPIHRAMGSVDDIGINLNRQAMALLACGQTAAARDTLEQALRASSYKLLTLRFCENLAPLALVLGHPAQAARMLGAARVRLPVGSTQLSDWELMHGDTLGPALAQALAPEVLAAHLAEGAALDDARLHRLALDWLASLR